MDRDCRSGEQCVDERCEAPGETHSESGDEGTASGTSSEPKPGNSEDTSPAAADDGPCDPSTPPACEGDSAISFCDGGESVVRECLLVCLEGGYTGTTGCGTEDGAQCLCTGPEEMECGQPGEICENQMDCCGPGTMTAGCVNVGDFAACSALCELNADCNSDCCLALVGQDYGACVPDEYCVTGPCGLPECDYDWCADPLAGDCPIAFNGDGSCDCGCQFYDSDCG